LRPYAASDLRPRDCGPGIQGAVTSAFNDTKVAEKYLNQTSKGKPNSDNAEDAHGILAKLCAGAGVAFYNFLQTFAMA
jgi:hypothetical protein